MRSAPITRAISTMPAARGGRAACSTSKGSRPETVDQLLDRACGRPSARAGSRPRARGRAASAAPGSTHEPRPRAGRHALAVPQVELSAHQVERGLRLEVVRRARRRLDQQRQRLLRCAAPRRGASAAASRARPSPARRGRDARALAGSRAPRAAWGPARAPAANTRSPARLDPGRRARGPRRAGEPTRSAGALGHGPTP